MAPKAATSWDWRCNRCGWWHSPAHASCFWCAGMKKPAAQSGKGKGARGKSKDRGLQPSPAKPPDAPAAQRRPWVWLDTNGRTYAESLYQAPRAWAPRADVAASGATSASAASYGCGLWGGDFVEHGAKEDDEEEDEESAAAALKAARQKELASNLRELVIAKKSLGRGHVEGSLVGLMVADMAQQITDIEH